MKKLLHKTIQPFLIYVLIILLVSIPVYYYVIDSIWMNELDEHNTIIANKSSYALNRLELSPEELSNSIELWNQIQPGTNIEKIDNGVHPKDSTYTLEKQKEYVSKKSIDRFRCLQKVVVIHHNNYLFTVQTNVEESKETIVVIALVTLFFFLLIVAGLLLLTRRLSHSIWKPFRDTLNKLKTFNLKQQTGIEFNTTDIAEFEALNDSVKKLIEHSVVVYKTQKEFTENASHELQTPLAILQHKLDTLLQNKDLTQDQYSLIEDMHKALSRSSRINKNLLLLAKIENHQFADNETFYLDEVLQQNTALQEEYFEQKGIHFKTHMDAHIAVKGSSFLCEILINNLLVNALKYTPAQGNITIQLSASLLEISNSGQQALDSSTLFERFSKQAKANSGSGLGLAIVKSISRYHHWDIHYRYEDKQHIFSLHL